MAKVPFSKLGLKAKNITSEVKVNDDLTLEVRNYLPMNEKADFLQFVVNNALDDKTGCFSPLRLEIYFSIALCKYYASINFTEKQMTDVYKIYDLLEDNGINKQIINAIPSEEYQFIQDLTKDTADDIERYNTSAVGIIQSMSDNAGGLDAQLTDILSKIKSGDGLQALNLLKDTVEVG